MVKYQAITRRPCRLALSSLSIVVVEVAVSERGSRGTLDEDAPIATASPADVFATHSEILSRNTARMPPSAVVVVTVAVAIVAVAAVVESTGGAPQHLRRLSGASKSPSAVSAGMVCACDAGRVTDV